MLLRRLLLPFLRRRRKVGMDLMEMRVLARRPSQLNRGSSNRGSSNRANNRLKANSKLKASSRTDSRSDERFLVSGGSFSFEVACYGYAL